MEMEQSGENTEMRTKKNVGQKLVTEKRKTKNPLQRNGFFVYMINSDYSHSVLLLGTYTELYKKYDTGYPRWLYYPMPGGYQICH